MTTIFVVDTNKSALYTAATARANLIGGEVIECNKFSSPHSLLRCLIGRNPETIVFCWRRALLDMTSSYRKRRLYGQLHLNSSLGVLIPDHLGLEPRFWLKEFQILSMCDYYYVTNRLLFSQYSALLPNFPPRGVLHDLPNQVLVNQTRKNHPKKDSEYLRIIWVGNSRWGERLGFVDHKGLSTIIYPLQKMLQESGAKIKFDIIDSNSNFISQNIVLQRIRESDILLQTSQSEGTGLPVLEAIGLETFVLTTDVGIAREISTFFSFNRIVKRDPFDFFRAIKLLVSNFNGQTHTLRRDYDRYVEDASEELIDFLSKRDLQFFAPYSLRDNIRTIILWKFKYLKKIFN